MEFIMILLLDLPSVRVLEQCERIVTDLEFSVSGQIIDGALNSLQFPMRFP
jgi:hypothetical protein